MRALLASLKTSLVFYVAVFLSQVAMFFISPPYFVSSPNQTQIPAFIKWSFIKYFGLIFGLYLIWALLLGLVNGAALYLSQAPIRRRRWGSLTVLPWVAAQFLSIILLLSFYYPTLFTRMPPLGRLPLGFNYGILAALVLLFIGLALRRQTQGWLRSLICWSGAALLPAGILLFLIQPAKLSLPPAPPLAAGGRPNLLLLGFDAMDGDSGNATLKRALAGGGHVFSNAFTPLPLTNPAWNSILSGLYPDKHNVRFFFGSPQPPLHPELYLPVRLKKEAGYSTLFASDQPETSYFTAEQGFDASVLGTVGWKAHLAAMMMNHFVLPAVWINNSLTERFLGLNINTPSVYNYDPARFFNEAFKRFVQISNGPRMMALHTCFLHTPVRLTHREISALPGYLAMNTRDFSFWKWPEPGKEKPQTPAGWINPYYLRREIALQFIADLVEELKKKSYFDSAVTALFSDHGERFSKNYEIYGGIHGVDLETREQNNVMLALAGPGLNELVMDPRWVSLIDLTPTLLTLSGLEVTGRPYDGVALLDAKGNNLPLPDRPILAESMGFIEDSAEQNKFPRLSIQSLEESLIYHEDGEVIIGPEYYQRILKKKVSSDLSKDPQMLAPLAGKTSMRE